MKVKELVKLIELGTEQRILNHFITAVNSFETKYLLVSMQDHDLMNPEYEVVIDYDRNKELLEIKVRDLLIQYSEPNNVWMYKNKYFNTTEELLDELGCHYNLRLPTAIDRFKSGRYNTKDKELLFEAGWYDWFCNDSELTGKTKTLYNKLLEILPTTKFNISEVYVFFKNNCPMNDELYDDFRICDLITSDVIYTITPYYSVDKCSAIWGRENKFKEPLLKGDWEDVITYFRKK